MPVQGSAEAARVQVQPRWDRMKVAGIVTAYEEVRRRDGSQREFAQAVGVPRTTLQYWQARKEGLDAEPALVAFFESPVGLAFLHRLLVGLHFVFGQVGLNGVDLLCEFLKRTGLDAFVAASHGQQHGVASAMTEAIFTFGQQQRRRQAAVMPQRTIALAEDETFPEGVWLVAMDPASGFIVLEQEAANREAATWTQALEAALEDLWVTVAVAGADEAAGLAAHATAIGAHHAPDVFHVQHPLWQALARPLHQSLERPAAALARAVERTTAWRERWQAHQEGRRPVGRPPDFAHHLAEAEAAEAEARAAHETVTGRKEAAYAAIRRLGSAYHPVDPTTGALRDATTVECDLNAAMDTLHQAAEAIGLSQKRRDLIAKAGRVVPKMVATITFFYAELGRQLAALNLPAAVLAYAEQVLMPATYLARLAERATTVAERDALLRLRQTLLAGADPTVPALLTPYQWGQVQRTVLTCVDLFVRSTSCVEGRNGRLALWHHHLHRLSAKRLAVLTVIHNYWIQRADGTTAAERFFEVPHDDLFEWLLDHMDLPARPAVEPAHARAA
jgi:hypothetical protein